MRRILIMLLLACSLSVAIPAGAQTTVSRYAYLMADGKSYSLAFIDPLNPSAAPQTVYLDLHHPNHFPYRHVPSPDGQWILFNATTKEITSVTLLFELASGEMHEITRAPLDHTDNLFTGSAQDAVWSPDSQRIAFVLRNSVPDDEFSTDVFIYDTNEHRLTRLTPDNFRNHRVAWSPDSTRIVTFTADCIFSPFRCRNRVEVFDIFSGDLVESVDFSHFADFSGGYDCACELAWSPTGRYISFVIGCKIPMFNSEVYVWDIELHNLHQVTHYTDNVHYPVFPNFTFTTYTAAWVDSQTLLVGAHVTRNVNPTYEQSATLSYDVSDGTTTILSRNAAEFLTVNPNSQAVAFRSIPTFMTDFVGARRPQAAFVNIAMFDDAVLDTWVTPIDGCELTWQPNGDVLAAVSYEVTWCRGDIKAFIFVNRINGSTLSHFPQQRSGGRNIYPIPIGWVSVDSNLISGVAP